MIMGNAIPITIITNKKCPEEILKLQGENRGITTDLNIFTGLTKAGVPLSLKNTPDRMFLSGAVFKIFFQAGN